MSDEFHLFREQSSKKLPSKGIDDGNPPAHLKSPKTIFVVDDDPIILQTLEVVLANDYNMVGFLVGTEAVEKVDDSVFVVVLDVKMKDKDGFQIFAEIKKKYQHLPIIFYSAYQDLRDPYDIMNTMRPFGYVSKEKSARNLLDTIESAVAYYQQVQDNAYLVTELEQRAADLEETNRLKDEFLANTSHELRTPLNGIIGIIDSLLHGAGGRLSKPMRQNISLVLKSAERLSHLINDILDFSKMRKNQIDVNFKPIDMKNLVGHTLQLIAGTLRTYSVDLSNDLPDDLPPVLGDESRIQQVLYNLIGNAVKFTPKGSVKVGATILENEICFSVSDTGIGIKTENLESIFESFEQGAGGVDREFGGTGLGLSISKRLIELHGSTITVESTEGEGSVFSFKLKIDNEENAVETATEPKQATLPNNVLSEPLEEKAPVVEELPVQVSIDELEHIFQEVDEEKSTILCVDDELVNLQVLLNHLLSRNYNVIVASAGKESTEHHRATETGPCSSGHHDA